MTEANQSLPDQLLHAHHILRAHQDLLDDAVRNRAFYAALRKRITPESSVLDIGSGTGVWAIAAALLGARRVVAVEKDELLAAIIRRLARENNVYDKIEILQGDSREIALGRRFDIVISETIGNLGFDEQIVPILLDARKRFLKRGGSLIPSSVALMAAAARHRTRSRKTPAGVPQSCDYFNALNINIPVVLRERSRLRIISEPGELIRVDLASIKKLPELGNLMTRWKLKDVSAINCVAVWAEATLTEGEAVSALDTASWSPIVYPIKSFKNRTGELEFKLDLSEQSNYWTATLSTKDDREVQGYSPVLAFLSLKGSA